MAWDASRSIWSADLGRRADEVFAETSVVHDLGNLIQIAASALNAASRSPRAANDLSLEPLLARGRLALEQAGVLVRQTMGRTRHAPLVVRAAPDLQDVPDCVGEIEALIRWACEPDIELHLVAEPDLPPVRCDRLDLQRAILNLVINGRDAMPGGGAMTIRIGCADVGLRDELEVHVADNGCGMSPLTLQRAFTPFFTTKDDGRGAGLGLPMVRRFAHEAGGRVEIASTPGSGTTVALRLPVEPGSENAKDTTWTKFNP